MLKRDKTRRDFENIAGETLWPFLSCVRSVYWSPQRRSHAPKERRALLKQQQHESKKQRARLQEY